MGPFFSSSSSASRSLGRKSHQIEKEETVDVRRPYSGNEFFEGSPRSRTTGRTMRKRGTRRERSRLVSPPPFFVLVSPLSLLSRASLLSFRHTSAPPLFQPLHPRFFIRLFARAFRHLTPVVSRHRRSCPTITKDFVRRY